jgi:glycogen(starch) synthase
VRGLNPGCDSGLVRGNASRRPRVKILALSNLYPPDFVGGYEISTAQVVDALRLRGHEMRVLTSAPRTPVAEVPHIWRRFKLVEDPSWSAGHIWFHPLAARLREGESRFVNAHNVHVLTTTLEEFPPDVVYISSLIGLGGLALIACLNYMRIPWVWQLGDDVPAVLCSLPHKFFPVLGREFSRQFPGHYLAVSQQLLDRMKARGLSLQGAVEVLPCWLAGERPPARTTFYQGGTLRIMSAGQVSRQKGIGVLIEAAARLRDSGYSSFAIDIYGQPQSLEFPGTIQKLDLGRHVTLLGRRPQRELQTLYSTHDVFAFPTVEREPFGLVPLEAAARGCVPIISQLCGIAEWLVHGVHCLKSARTPEAFAQVFRAIMDGRIELEPIARRGAVTAWRDFHLDAILPRIERTLFAAVGQSRSGGGSSADAYRLARLAEQLTEVLIQESLCA